MQKELNPDLFGTEAAGNTRFRDNSEVPAGRHSQQQDEKLALLRAEFKAGQDQLAAVVAQVNEFIKIYQHKIENTQSGLKSLESTALQTNSEVGQRISQLHLRLNERRSMDAKMQEMIDRHNGVLRTYEVRMNQLQKLITEKEHQLVQSQSALNEAKMEIARLKRF